MWACNYQRKLHPIQGYLQALRRKQAREEPLCDLKRRLDRPGESITFKGATCMEEKQR